MTRETLKTEHLNPTGQNLTRILISSYFIAVALRLVDGTNGTIIAEWFFPEPIAALVASVVMFSLGYLVLMGLWLRPAALLLAIVVFWSSYIKNFGPTGPLEISEFWRDLALIGALMMTYTQTNPRDARRRAVLRVKPRVRRLTAGTQVSPRRVAAASGPKFANLKPAEASAPRPSPVLPRPVLVARNDALDQKNGIRALNQESENIFADDFGQLATA